MIDLFPWFVHSTEISKKREMLVLKKNNKSIMFLTLISIAMLSLTGCGAQGNQAAQTNQGMMNNSSANQYMKGNTAGMMSVMSSSDNRQSMVTIMGSPQMKPVMVDAMKNSEVRKNMIGIMGSRENRDNMVSIMSDPSMYEPMVQIMSDPRMKETLGAMLKDPVMQSKVK